MQETQGRVFLLSKSSVGAEHGVLMDFFVTFAFRIFSWHQELPSITIFRLIFQVLLHWAGGILTIQAFGILGSSWWDGSGKSDLGGAAGGGLRLGKKEAQEGLDLMILEVFSNLNYSMSLWR